MIYYKDFKFYHHRRWLGNGELNLLTFCENLGLCPFSATGEEVLVTRPRWVERQTGTLNFMLEVCDSTDHHSCTHKPALRELRNKMLLAAIDKAKESKLVDVSYKTTKYRSIVAFYFDGINLDNVNLDEISYRVQVGLNLNGSDFVISVFGHPMILQGLGYVEIRLLLKLRQRNLKRFLGEIGVIDTVKAQMALRTL